MEQWVAHLTCYVEAVGSSPIKGPHCFHNRETLPLLPHCFHEQETLPLLLSTGWLQERIRE